jgi:hypothetical protein
MYGVAVLLNKLATLIMLMRIRFSMHQKCCGQARWFAAELHQVTALELVRILRQEKRCILHHK